MENGNIVLDVPINAGIGAVSDFSVTSREKTLYFSIPNGVILVFRAEISYYPYPSRQ